MVQISLCMIVKNEEDVLARCLNSVQGIADEIIIVDTGSDDHTKEIAKQFTDNVLDFQWCDDFSAARNFSFFPATKDYILWLDADDVFLPEDRKRLIELKKSLSPDTSVVMMKYHTAFHEDGSPSFTYYRERLLKNHAGFQWKGAVHEAISPSGIILYSDIAVTHQKSHPTDPDRNLRIFEHLLNQGKKLQPREQFYYARELYYHAKYQHAIKEFEQFLSSKQGWIENIIEACHQEAYCYYALNEDTKALESLLKTLQYDLPRAEICCDIGKHFVDRSRYETAVFWYRTALSLPRNDNSGAFISPDCYGYLPSIMLCVCYDHLGDRKQAIYYNELAGSFKPNDPYYLSNRCFFEKETTTQP